MCVPSPASHLMDQQLFANEPLSGPRRGESVFLVTGGCVSRGKVCVQRRVMCNLAPNPAGQDDLNCVYLSWIVYSLMEPSSGLSGLINDSTTRPFLVACTRFSSQRHIVVLNAGSLRSSCGGLFALLSIVSSREPMNVLHEVAMHAKRIQAKMHSVLCMCACLDSCVRVRLVTFPCVSPRVVGDGG